MGERRGDNGDDREGNDPGESGHRLRVRLDRILSDIERPMRNALSVVKETVFMAAALAGATVSLVAQAYRDGVHSRLRRLVRFAVGTPLLLSLVYLLVMQHYYMPETPRHLDTRCVADLPLCQTADDLVEFALEARKAYRSAQRGALAAGRGTEGADRGGRAAVARTELTAEVANDTLRRLFVILRSIEKGIMGTPEERALIEPRTDLLGPEATTRSVAVDGVVTPSRVVANTRPASPAEFTLRVVLSIALEQGWFDVVEFARDLYTELVKHAPTPTQARVVTAVGELCTLSYELEQFRSGAELTLDQRRRLARAIDAFRPERSVEERSTIASEISVLPLPDAGNSTRCLSMIRHSRGRRPQLIMCFIGSNSAPNWLTNCNYLSAPLPQCYGVGGDARAHRGFLKLLDSISYRDVAEGFDEILLVGHSLGGALAQLAGLRLATERPSRRITVITMASPRVLAVGRRGAVSRGEHLAVATPAVTAAAGEEAVMLPTVVVAPEACDGPTGAVPAAHDSSAADDGAAALRMPPNYRHFRGYIGADIVPKLPPERLFGYTHVGSRIPLNTGCTTTLSFVGWGLWSAMFHSSSLYGSILKDPPVTQTHYYTPPPPPPLTTRGAQDAAS